MGKERVNKGESPTSASGKAERGCLEPRTRRDTSMAHVMRVQLDTQTIVKFPSPYSLNVCWDLPQSNPEAYPPTTMGFDGTLVG